MQHHAEISARRGRWAISRESPLLWQSWDDDEYVVYSSASGDTHLINEVTAEVLRQLERSELAFSDLVHNVAQTLGTEPDEPTENHIARLLVYLDQIGLVEPAP